MITSHSIDLTMIGEPCFGKARDGRCKVLVVESEFCGTYKCPFYKPKECRHWVRIEDRTGVNLIPPEEAYGRY